jgi:hypothetical protein
LPIETFSAGQVDKDAPEIAALRKLGVNRCDFPTRVKYILGHRLEVIDKRQVNLGVSEVRCGIGHHGAVVGGDEVVLLSPLSSFANTEKRSP